MKLIIDEFDHGECRGYRQCNGAWSFAMENGIEISVPFAEIKLFTSCGQLEIIINKHPEGERKYEH